MLQQLVLQLQGTWGDCGSAPQPQLEIVPPPGMVQLLVTTAQALPHELQVCVADWWWLAEEEVLEVAAVLPLLTCLALLACCRSSWCGPRR